LKEIAWSKAATANGAATKSLTGLICFSDQWNASREMQMLRTVDRDPNATA
jgi:hypothetical protein